MIRLFSNSLDVGQKLTFSRRNDKERERERERERETPYSLIFGLENRWGRILNWGMKTEIRHYFQLLSNYVDHL